jgi:hypothetical protein
MELRTYLRLVPRLRMSGAIPLLPLCALMAWTGKSLTFYGLFNEARNSSGYVMSNVRMSNELYTERVVERPISR